MESTPLAKNVPAISLSLPLCLSLSLSLIHIHTYTHLMCHLYILHIIEMHSAAYAHSYNVNNARAGLRSGAPKPWRDTCVSSDRGARSRVRERAGERERACARADEGKLTFSCISLCIYVYMYTVIHKCKYMCVNIYLCVCMYVCVCVCVCVCVDLGACVCVYHYQHSAAYTHTYVMINT